MKFKVVLEPQKGGGYTVYVPALPGCVSEGNTKEAIELAIELYLEPLEHGVKVKGEVAEVVV